MSILYVSKTGVLDFQMGVPLAVAGFVGTVVGGMDSLVGAVLGGLFLGCRFDAAASASAGGAATGARCVSL